MRNHVIWCILCENRFRGVGHLAVGNWKNPEKKPSRHFWCAISRIRGKETPWEIVTKICMWVEVQNLMTFATFGDDRLRSLGVARGRISRFSIDLRRRLYKPLLPCECAITTPQATHHAKFDFDSMTWVVWANSQFAAALGKLGVFFLSFFIPSFIPSFFVFFSSPTSLTRLLSSQT